ncbi:LAMI_0G13828g1_1 [Lachancea mirantina]|uniref:LAMI_0G13828g1_1 n=1 Tax=Lachancea mirantina TaxID=1230905 RepID=A0A1G4KBX6_9SACH|nr:LAMI_0G13828g1_1 [Lachancea mirantina]
MRIQKPVRLGKRRKMHAAPEHPRQGVLIDERFGNDLPQAPQGVFFLVEVYTEEAGISPNTVQEPDEERRVETSGVQIEEISSVEENDVEMTDV